MNKIVLSLLSLIAVSGILATGTYAIFSGQASNQGNTFATGNAELKINGDGSDNWQNSFTGSEWNNIYPGWQTSYKVYLKNTSTAPISLELRPKIEVPTASNWGLLDKVKMELTWEDGSNSTGAWHLRDWLTAQDNPVLNPVLAKDSSAGPWIVKFSVDPEAGNEIKDASMKFNLIFDGQQKL